MLKRKRLLTILESYGADSARWPQEERTAALATLRQQPDADALLQSAALVDDVLAKGATAAEQGLPPYLEATLAGIPIKEKQASAGFEFPSWLTAWPQLTTLAAAATVAGIIVGNTSLISSSPTEMQVELGAVLYGGNSIMESNS